MNEARRIQVMPILAAAKELQRFIDTQPKGQLIDPALHVDVRETETYRLAALAIQLTEEATRHFR